MYGEYETAEVANKGSVKVEEALSKTSCCCCGDGGRWKDDQQML